MKLLTFQFLSLFVSSSMSFQDRAEAYVSQHLTVHSELFQPVSQLLARILEQEMTQSQSFSPSSFPSHTKPRAYRRIKEKVTSDYIQFCHLLKTQHPELKHIQSIWKQEKHTDWRSKYSTQKPQSPIPLTQSPVTQSPSHSVSSHDELSESSHDDCEIIFDSRGGILESCESESQSDSSSP
jgi:hypothetical protein